MSATDARSAILAAVRAARPAPVAAPDVVAWRRQAVAPPAGDVVERFVRAAASAGADIIDARGDLAAAIGTLSAARPGVLSAIDHAVAGGDLPLLLDAVRELDLFVCRAELGVAENGAAWIAPTTSAHRAALFLATHVAIVLDRATIVDTMHDAYERIDLRAHTFGTFVAGPSKTADIEQSLVIGAHGPMGITLLLT